MLNGHYSIKRALKKVLVDYTLINGFKIHKEETAYIAPQATVAAAARQAATAAVAKQEATYSTHDFFKLSEKLRPLKG